MIFIIFEGLYFRKVIQWKKGGNWGGDSVYFDG